MIVLDNLRPLASSIRTRGETYGVFNFEYNQVTIDVFFDLGKLPFTLGLLPRGTDFSLWFDVETGFRVRSSLSSDEYYELVKVLGIKRDPKNKFSINAFLSFLNSKTPHNCLELSNSDRLSIASRVTDLEEPEKTVYCGIIDWSKSSSGKGRTAENLEKTRLLRPDLYVKFKDKNISVRFKAAEV